MKIFLTNRPFGAYGYVSDGWHNCLREQGHNVRRWDGSIQSWDRFKPDLYIGCSAHKQPIPERRTAKVAIHVNPYGSVIIPGISEDVGNINWTIEQKPDVVFGFGFESDRNFWSYWTKKHNIPWVPLPTAGDKTLFSDLSQNREYDIVYLGGRWQYKAPTMDVYLIPLLRDTRINYKLHGWGEWPDGLCDGPLAENQVVRFLNNGRVGPCVSERHTQHYGIDIPERVWKLALCGTLVIHDPVPGLGEHFNLAVIAENPEQYRELCVQYSRLSNKTKRAKLVNDQKKEVMSRHTYHHRLADLFRALGFVKEARQMLS